jgi:2-keto-3-deoxy-L-rhamnonate aldolase RhmA
MRGQNVTGEELKRKLHAGDRVYGTLIVSDSPRYAQESLAGAGLDFVFVDTEHIAIDRQVLSWMCVAYGAMGLPPVVRIPSPDPYEACKVLDGGAQGVIAPYIESVEQVRALVGAVKLRPLKGRRLERVLAGEETLDPETAAYLSERNRHNVLIINVESCPALERLDELFSIDGLDAALIGPHDLSVSLGLPEQYAHPTFLRAVDEILVAARRHHLGAGLHAVFPGAVEQEIRWANLGANLIVHQADLIAFRDTLRADIARIKAALGEQNQRVEVAPIQI